MDPSGVVGGAMSSTAMDRPPSPARLPYTSDKHPRHTLEAINVLRKHRELCDVVLIVGQRKRETLLLKRVLFVCFCTISI